MKSAVVILACAGLAACSVQLETPQARQAVSARYTAAVPQAGTELNQDWWGRFRDGQLDKLLVLARENSPSLRSAAARVIGARAGVQQTRAGQLPSVTAQANSTVSGRENTRRSISNSAGIDARWELDLFAKASSQTEASRTRAQAEEVTFAGAYVSLSSEIADTYVQYRACRLTETVYHAARSSQRDTVEATSSLVDAGLSTDSDLALARANASSSAIIYETTRANCRVIAQRLAVTAGAPQDQIDQVLAVGSRLPSPRGFRVSAVPANLLRQRPDIVAAELQFAAQLADTRVAQADLYPSLSLSGNLTRSGTTGWQFGPALSLPIFDAGARRASVIRANANAVVAAETYRSVVLNSVAEVEGALTRLNSASRQSTEARNALSNFQSFFAATNENWRAGGATLLNREDARRQVQNAQITEINVREDRLRQWIALYKAVGGGWHLQEPTTETNQETSK